MMTSQRLLPVLIVWLSVIAFQSYGTHLRAGEIAVTQIGCTGSYTISLTLYGNLQSPTPPGGDLSFLRFGDGTFVVVPDGIFVSRPGLPDGVGVFVYDIDHTFAGPGVYVISYSEPNRNGGVLNVSNSITTVFYVETRLVIVGGTCNSSPVLLSPPVDRACTGLAFFHNPSAFDVDGDSVAYRLTVPLRETNQAVMYTPPDHPSLYQNYESSNEAGDGPPLFMIDPVTGTISWDSPGVVGEYNIAFIVEEWRKINGVYTKISETTRDMQIIVEECNNQRPVLIVPEDICVVAGTTISENIFGTDPDGQDVKIEVFSGIFSLPGNAAFFSPDPPVYQSSVPQASLSFEWTPDCADVRNQPYQITVKITDNPPSGPALVLFKIWNIKVTAPAPDLENAELDFVKREAAISWAPYSCPNAERIEVWRRVGRFSYSPDSCSSGLPAFAGYSKIGDAQPGALQFVDTNNGGGLAPGAVYCYRLTAVFPLEGGAESKASIELCLPPVIAEAPVITHVTVNQTRVQNGEVTVSWRSPYDLSEAEYLKPYEYRLLRATGLESDSDLTNITFSSILDTTFTDTGLNTLELAYNYRIVLLAKRSQAEPVVPIDTSARASSVRAFAEANEDGVELTWNAITPWSNVSVDYPMHLIYRSNETNGLNSFELVDSVDVFRTGFVFLDNSPGLEEHELYCYRILTRGTYGNPAIRSPLENFSQTICSTVLDTIPPCEPVLIATSFDCEAFNIQTPCSQLVFSHTLHWYEPNAQCLDDIYFHKIYASNQPDSEYEWIGSADGREYTEDGLEDLKRCYKITSVDRAGNESAFSNELCFDNCPEVYFPNVFTPNGDEHNEYFTAYNSDQFCLRSVKSISLRVFNRWGQKVAEIAEEGTVFWDGLDSAGRPVPGGVYFYVADVIFDVLDTNNQARKIKGWIHIAY